MKGGGEREGMDAAETPLPFRFASVSTYARKTDGMAVREIVIYPAPVLTTAGKDVERVDDSVRAFLDDMADTMYAASGVGLAANQVGDLRRICVIDTSETAEERQSRANLIELVNPKIVEEEGKITWEEGCLSFPELFEKVDRAAWIRVRALNRDGEPFELEAEELLSVALQHEIDHLDGIVFPERMSRLKRRMALKRFARISENLRSEQDALGENA